MGSSAEPWATLGTPKSLPSGKAVDPIRKLADYQRSVSNCCPKLRPVLHQPAAALEQIRPGEGGPRLVPLHMVHCQINDFPGNIASAAQPSKPGAVTTRKNTPKKPTAPRNTTAGSPIRSSSRSTKVPTSENLRHGKETAWLSGSRGLGYAATRRGPPRPRSPSRPRRLQGGAARRLDCHPSRRRVSTAVGTSPQPK